VLFGLQHPRAKDPDKVRADCEASTREVRDLCGCIVHEMLRVNGARPEALARLEDQMRATEQDRALLPAAFNQAAEVCLGRA
jgi:hypothetical protein